MINADKCNFYCIHLFNFFFAFLHSLSHIFPPHVRTFFTYTPVPPHTVSSYMGTNVCTVQFIYQKSIRNFFYHQTNQRKKIKRYLPSICVSYTCIIHTYVEYLMYLLESIHFIHKHHITEECNFL